MALTNYDEYIDRLRDNRTADYQTSVAIARPQRWAALWPSFVPAPTIPSSSIALNSDSPQAIGPIPNIGTGSLAMLGARANPGGAAGVSVMAIDLLNVQGGLSGTLTTAQTTNLPTTPLTRYTDGYGVMAALIVHTNIGTTATTVSASYTNSDGVSGRLTTPTAIGGAAASLHSAARSFILLPLQGGDNGVRSVEAVSLQGTTGTVGNFGVCLFKPLAIQPLNNVEGAHVIDAVSSGGFGGALSPISSSACISLVASANVAQTVNGTFILGEI